MGEWRTSESIAESNDYLFVGLDDLAEELVGLEVAVGKVVFDLLLDFGLIDAHSVGMKVWEDG